MKSRPSFQVLMTAPSLDGTQPWDIQPAHQLEPNSYAPYAVGIPGPWRRVHPSSCPLTWLDQHVWAHHPSLAQTERA